MLPEHFLQLNDIVLGGHFIGRNHLFVQTDIKIIILIQHVSNSAAHACRKIFAGSAKHHYTPACHILAAVIAYALHNRNSP